MRVHRNQGALNLGTLPQPENDTGIRLKSLDWDDIADTQNV
jgi:hypothetical protein